MRITEYSAPFQEANQTSEADLHIYTNQKHMKVIWVAEI
jgi:hypothetical protein